MTNIKFMVEGMTCGHCKAAVGKALKEINGVSSVHVELQTREVAVQYDEAKTNPAAMKAAVEDMGYDVAGI